MILFYTFRAGFCPVDKMPEGMAGQGIARYHKDIDTIVVQFTSTSGRNSWMTSEAFYNRIVRILRNHKD